MNSSESDVALKHPWQQFVEGDFGESYDSSGDLANALFGLFALDEDSLSRVFRLAGERLLEYPEAERSGDVSHSAESGALVSLAVCCTEHDLDDLLSAESLQALAPLDWGQVEFGMQRAIVAARKLEPEVRSFFDLTINRPLLLVRTQWNYAVHVSFMQDAESDTARESTQTLDFPIAALTLWQGTETNERFTVELTERTLQLLQRSIDAARIRMAQLRGLTRHR
jgi:hypothetical protein